MHNTKEEPLPLPTEAIAPLTQGVKAFREALLILEPWVAGLPVSGGRIVAHRQTKLMKQFLIQVEQSLVANP